MSNSEANVGIFRAAVVKNKFSSLTQPKLDLKTAELSKLWPKSTNMTSKQKLVFQLSLC